MPDDLENHLHGPATSARLTRLREEEIRLDKITPQKITDAVISVRRAGKSPTFHNVCIAFGNGVKDGGLWRRLRRFPMSPIEDAQHKAFRDACNLDIAESSSHISTPQAHMQHPAAVTAEPQEIGPPLPQSTSTPLPLEGSNSTKEDLVLNTLSRNTGALLDRIKVIRSKLWAKSINSHLSQLNTALIHTDNELLDIEELPLVTRWTPENKEALLRIASVLEEIGKQIQKCDPPVLE